MKRISGFIFLSLFFYNGFSQQQFALAGPKGIFIYLDKKIPNGVKISSITLQRKEASGDFKNIAEVKSSTDENSFISKAKDNNKYFPDYSFPPDSVLKTIWTKAAKTGLLDSIGYWGMHPAVRMALGILYYDLEAKEKIQYTYKVTVNGNTREERISSAVSFPFYPKYDDVTLYEYQFDKNGLYIKLKSVGKNAPSAFKIFKYNDAGKAEEVRGQHSKYSVKDSTYYIVNDKNVTAGKTYQYAWVGVDALGNTSYGSGPYIIGAKDFSLVYFKRSKADKLKGGLGIKLTWQLSDVSQAASIHIFKSEKFDGKFLEAGTVKNTDTTFTDDNITPDKIYYYYLQAKDKTGTQWKNSAKFFDYGLDTRKPITAQIDGGFGVKNGVKLELIIPDDNIVGYRVFRSENGSDDYTVIADLVAVQPDNNRSVYFDTLSMSGRTIYNYRIETENTSHITSDKSNKVQVRPDMPTNPPAPSQLEAYYQDSVIHLFWNDAKNGNWFVGGYRIYKREQSQKKAQLLLPADSVFEGTRFIDASYDYGKTYEYEIETMDVFGEASSTRAVASVSIPELLPVSPAISRAFSLPDGIRIEWTQPNMSDLKNYKLYRYQRGQNALLLAQPDSKTNWYLDKTVKAGELYFYTLTSVNSKAKESAESAEVGVRK